MPVLSINGINAGALIATIEEPKGGRRDIGEEAQGSDGSLRITRQTRKRDLTIKSVPLSTADALAWESLCIGEGEVWSFDSSVYGSKGLGPAAATGTGYTHQIATSKFGVGRLRVNDTSGNISFPGAATNLFGRTSDWAVCVWYSADGVTWTHYVVRSDGAKWVDAVRNDAASTTWLSVSSGTVSLNNTNFFSYLFDDLIVFPFLILNAWPAQIFARTTAYPPTPYVDLTGDMVTEQATRRVLGAVTDTTMKTASALKTKLSIEFKAK